MNNRKRKKEGKILRVGYTSRGSVKYRRSNFHIRQDRKSTHSVTQVDQDLKETQLNWRRHHIGDPNHYKKFNVHLRFIILLYYISLNIPAGKSTTALRQSSGQLILNHHNLSFSKHFCMNSEVFEDLKIL